MVSYLSVSHRYIVVLSVYRLIRILDVLPGMENLVKSGEFLMDAAKGSIARLNSRHDRGLPCLTPLVTLYGLLRMPLMATWVYALAYRDLIVSMKSCGSLKCT